MHNLTTLKHYREQLDTSGAVVVPLQDLPWTPQECAELAHMTCPTHLPFRRAERGDTGELNPVSYYRILHPVLQETSLPECMEIVNDQKTRDFFHALTGLPSYDIDRCQTHVYTSGDFIATHVDSDSCPEYVYSTVFLMTDDYEGGEFVVHSPKGPVALKPSKFSLIITKSNLPHEVREVKKGSRRSLCFFLKP